MLKTLIKKLGRSSPYILHQNCCHHAAAAVLGGGGRMQITDFCRLKNVESTNKENIGRSFPFISMDNLSFYVAPAVLGEGGGETGSAAILHT